MKEAQFRIGDHLLRGEAGFECNPEEAVGWLAKSAEQGYDQAQYTLAFCYETGSGIKEDISQAATWYQMASKQGNQQAGERLRACVERLGQPAVPITAVGKVAERESVDSNDPETLYALACKVRDSGKRLEDRAKASNMFKRAALLGHDLAQLAYINLALNNPAEEDEAMDWLEKASAQNNERATLMLAAALRSGTGCAADPKRSQTLLDDLANKQNNPIAQAMIGCALLVGDGVGRNIPRGITILKKAAEADDGYAQWKLALCFRNGLGVMKDARQVETLFQRAAEAGFPLGVDELWKPSGLQFSEAIPVFNSLAGLGNRHAFYWLGICYENGIGVARDISQALSYYEQAHSKGMASCQKAIERIKASAV